MGIYYLWKLSDAELYRRSSRPKYLVIICIKVAPGKPRATLCLALQKDSSAGPLPARDKKKMAGATGCLWGVGLRLCRRGSLQLKVLFCKRNLCSALMGTVSSLAEKSRKPSKLGLLFPKKKKKEKRNHIFMLGQCPNL